MLKSFREGFFGALAYGAGMLAVVPFTFALLFIWAAVGTERFSRNIDAINAALKDAERSLAAARSGAR
jgi:hypothetical protein